MCVCVGRIHKRGAATIARRVRVHGMGVGWSDFLVSTCATHLLDDGAELLELSLRAKERAQLESIWLVQLPRKYGKRNPSDAVAGRREEGGDNVEGLNTWREGSMYVPASSSAYVPSYPMVPAK